MNKKIVIASFVGAIVNFLLGWLVFGMLLKDYYDSYTIKYDGLMKETPVIYGIFLSGLSWCFLVAYIFGKWSGTNTFAKGFVNGMLIGCLLTICYDIFFFSFMNLMAKRLIVVDVFVNTVYSGIVGGVIAWVLGMGKKNESGA